MLKWPRQWVLSWACGSQSTPLHHVRLTFIIRHDGKNYEKCLFSFTTSLCPFAWNSSAPTGWIFMTQYTVQLYTIYAANGQSNSPFPSSFPTKMLYILRQAFMNVNRDRGSPNWKLSITPWFYQSRQISRTYVKPPRVIRDCCTD
jgi:hypothetical protein